MSSNVSNYLNTNDKDERRGLDAKGVLFILFVTPSKKWFFQLSHLYCGTEDGTLQLYFTDHVVTLEGKGLEKLGIDIMRHTRSIVEQVDPVHAGIAGEEMYVTKISVVKRGE